jgi:hypothetical protein
MVAILARVDYESQINGAAVCGGGLGSGDTPKHRPTVFTLTGRLPEDSSWGFPAQIDRISPAFQGSSPLWMNPVTLLILTAIV